MIRLAVILGVLAVIGAVTLWWRRREGRFAEAHGRFDRTDLGIERRERPSAILVEFWGENCAPCVTVQERLERIASEVPDVRIVGIDAGARMDLSDRYEVRRVPTVFVADSDLRIIWRASGVPSEDAIRGALLGPDWAGRPHPQQERARRR
jgi:thiol-disulfide isomerase/thioredoxin